MKKIKVSDAVQRTLPHPVGLLTTIDKSGKTNVMTISWFTVASLSPPKALFCLSKKGYSHTLLSEVGQFTLSVPSIEIAEKTIKAGKIHGFDTDKINEIGFQTDYPKEFIAPVISGCTLAFSLTVCDQMDAGDHIVFLADIKKAVEGTGKKQVYAVDNYKVLKELR